MNSPVPYQQPGALAQEGRATDVIAQHAAADALINRLLTTPVYRPRDQGAVMQRIKLEALAAGEDFFYSWQAKLKGGGKSEISGPSIELAIAIANAAGNCGYTVTHIETPDAWVFTAYFVERETGMVHGREFRQRRTQKTFGDSKRGKDDGREEDIAFQIGQSKAIRNVIVRALKPLCDYAMREARQEMVKRIAANPTAFRERIFERLKQYEIPHQRVAHWVGRSADKWEPTDMVKIGAALQAVAEGLVEPAELWPDPEMAKGPPPAPPLKGDVQQQNTPPPAEPPADGPPGPDPNQQDMGI